MNTKNLDKDCQLFFKVNNLNCEAEANVITEEETIKIFNIKVLNQVLQHIKNLKIADFSKQIKINGFRPGKVPTHLVWQKKGDAITKEVIEDIINKLIQSIINKYHFQLTGYPKIVLKKADLDESLEFDAYFELFPIIELPDLEQISISKAVFEIQESDIKHQLNEFIKTYTHFINAEDSYIAQEGDKVIIDFEGTIDDVNPEKVSEKDFNVEIGTESLIGDFESRFIGSKKNDSLVLEVTFPEDYHHTKYAAKNAKLFATVKEIRQRKKIETYEELATILSLDSVEMLYDKTKKITEAACAQKVRTQMKTELFNQLDDMVKFPIPKSLLEEEHKSVLEQMESLDVEKDELQPDYLKLAERRVKLGLLLVKASQLFNIEVTNADITETINNQLDSRSPEIKRDLIEYYQKNPKAIELLRWAILEEKVTNEIFNKVKIIERPIQTLELLNQDRE